MARRRNLKRLNLREGCPEPVGPQPADYLRKIKEWLEDGRTQARQALEVMDWYDLGYLWVCWPLPPEYRIPASRPGEGRQEQVTCSEDAAGRADAEDEETDETAQQVVLRIGINEEFRLWVDFNPPDHDALDVELDLDVKVQLDPRSVELHHRYLFDEMGCGEGFEVVKDLDIFEPDTATFLKEVLARFGIDLYCPVTSIGDAFAGKP